MLAAANASAAASTMVLYLALFRTLSCHDAGEDRLGAREYVVALVAAALITLKSNAVPYAGLLLVTFYVAFSRHSSSPQRAAGDAARAMAATGLILLPWMIAMYLSAGTLLYPFLGPGYSGTAYGTFPRWSQFTLPGDLLPDLRHSAAIGLAAISLCAFRPAPAERAATLCLLVATIGGTTAMLWATAGYPRYTYAFVIAAIIVFAADIARHLDTVSRRVAAAAVPRLMKRAPLAVDLAAIVALSAASMLVLPGATSVWLPDVKALVAQLRTLDDTKTRMFDDQSLLVRRAQQSIPRGHPLLAMVATPFLLDFTRNRIYVVDWAHGGSPPPGMPFGNGSDALAEYLQSISIRYVLYEHDKHEFWYPGGDPRCRTRESAAPILSRADGEIGVVAYECAMDIATADFIRNLDELVATREAIFNDGSIAMIDLSKRR